MPVSLTGPGEQSVSGGQALAQQQATKAAELAAKVKQQVTGAMTAGWVILALGASGYLLSETKIFGPLVAVFLSIATIFQLNQWVQRKGGKIL
jgi:ABC-type transport system involved in cytochrome bd biosynthesis fused ATPase/permease subunit